MSFTLSERDKFALIAVDNVYADFSDGFEAELKDGTWVLTTVPFEIESIWKDWIGSIRADKLKKSNLVLIRTLQSNNPSVLDDEQKSLGNHVGHVFNLLQLTGILEYGGADILKGSFYNGKAEVRQHHVLPQFFPTKGYTRTPVTLDRLQDAATLTNAIAEIYLGKGKGDFARLGRGLVVLMNGLQQRTGQEKLHQCVRSLEALILPETGKTQKNFVHRCQTFAKAGTAAVKILDEAFEMRSDAEHIHNFERSLSEYDASTRSDVAFHRTRQMEALASFAYSRILRDTNTRAHFKDETVQNDFWKKLDDAKRRSVWGVPFDLESVPFADNYDGFDRAKR